MFNVQGETFSQYHHSGRLPRILWTELPDLDFLSVRWSEFRVFEPKRIRKGLTNHQRMTSIQRQC